MPNKPKRPPLLKDFGKPTRPRQLSPALAWDVLANRAGQPLPVYLQNLLETLRRPSLNSEDMFCFILYDIEDDKVRRLVAQYLEKKGCLRVQKSVFFARLHRRHHREIADTLREIQQAYENNDSLLLVPVGEDMLNNLICIGKTFEFELMTRPRSTLFI
ncbi:MAG: CRISPR-associated endonuclease Cas2 [Cytophagaceae bacterium]|nr:CRISPR-associated endonuclease Cas2 [Cytophagaceae bacterium]